MENKNNKFIVHTTQFKNDRQLETRKFKRRIIVMFLFTVVLLYGILLFRFYFLQVLHHDHYQTLAENNRISIVPIPPSRGLIFDRNGIVLAQNYSAFTLEITPSKAINVDKTIDELSEIIEVTQKDRKRFKKVFEESKNFESIPIRNRLSETEIAKFAVNRYRFPGVELKARLFRHYPMGETASHLLGYIGRINDRDLQKLEQNEELSNYRGTDHIGKMGIEQSYEKVLHGITGMQQIETDAGGRGIRILQKTPPIAGKNLYLSIDIKLQMVAEKAFGNRRGALVAIDPRNGEILAMVSRPSFDPNLFVDGIDYASWNALNKSIDKPLINRALRGVYPPGSTIKPFYGLLGLMSGRRGVYSSISDPGYFTLPGSSHRYRDWKASGHGTVDLHRSIVESCDTYYYVLANELGIDAMHDFMDKFSFGKKTGIDIDGELSGLMPSKAWKQKRYKQQWYAGETVIAGIGQGYTLATPLQLAHGTAMLANKGVGYKPRLVHKIDNGKTSELLQSEIISQVNIRKEHFNAIRNAMMSVLRPGGTAAKAGAGASYSIAGKTGTAQVVGIKQNEKYVESRVKERHRDHALFMAFAPADKPVLAIGVLVENGGHGGSVAAPIARHVFDFHILGQSHDPNEIADDENPNGTND